MGSGLYIGVGGPTNSAGRRTWGALGTSRTPNHWRASAEASAMRASIAASTSPSSHKTSSLTCVCVRVHKCVLDPDPGSWPMGLDLCGIWPWMWP